MFTFLQNKKRDHQEKSRVKIMELSFCVVDVEERREDHGLTFLHWCSNLGSWPIREWTDLRYSPGTLVGTPLHTIGGVPKKTNRNISENVAKLQRPLCIGVSSGFSKILFRRFQTIHRKSNVTILVFKPLKGTIHDRWRESWQNEWKSFNSHLWSLTLGLLHRSQL